MSTCVHVAGIGGVGMSAVAQALLDQGMLVSGSDRLLDTGDLTETLACLASQGVRLCPQDGSGVTPQTERLVTSSAIEMNNPERVKAKTLGIPMVHRAAEVAHLVAEHRLIAVTGTCGKSTVTALLGTLLEGAGFDPFVINGATVPAWENKSQRVGSVRAGLGEWAVVEADESDKSLMVFSPEHAIITNASSDHFGIEETRALFADFRARVSGVVIDGCDEQKRPEEIRCEGWQSSFRWEGVRYELPMPGVHNVYNAWFAVRMARTLDADPERLKCALAQFSGVARRLQRVGMCQQAVVVDDYAHNPAKLAAAWQTLSDAFPGGICAVWRPHGYAPLRKMMTDLVRTFKEVCRAQDTLLLLPVYDAGGSADRTLGSDVLASLLLREGVKVIEVKTLAEAEAHLRACAQNERVLVTFGARDPGLPRLAAKLAEKQG